MPSSAAGTGVLTFPASTFSRSTLRFNVTASKGVQGGVIPYHYRAATGTVLVQVVDGLVPTLTPALSSVVVNPAAPRLVLAVDVNAHGDSSLALQWSAPSLTADQLTRCVSHEDMYTRPHAVTYPNPHGK